MYVVFSTDYRLLVSEYKAYIPVFVSAIVRSVVSDIEAAALGLASPWLQTETVATATHPQPAYRQLSLRGHDVHDCSEVGDHFETSCFQEEKLIERVINGC